MLTIIVLLVVGSALAYISKFNIMPVTVNFGRYAVTDVPLFYVIIGSVTVGLVVSYLFYLVNAIATSLKLRGKDQEIKKHKNIVLSLTKRVHQLELEHEKQKTDASFEPSDENAL
ncbi:MAG: LapA family protein [Candidatus Pacebacteria bacterium]|nr:LapA family protein [Candidatus Paceibacterota bacterium]PIR60481.1 MAG: hypothetical protein COU67_01765 [Candidatus Pacebacteria bacterium CG10_big_fil_rev_8_21_14_0_10_44_54]